MNKKKTNSGKPTLDELVFGALSQLQVLRYNARSIRRYQAIWNRLIKFTKKNDFENKLTKKLIIQFLNSYSIKTEEPIKNETGWRKHAEYSLKILWQFSRYGYFERIHTLIQKLNIAFSMKKILKEYVTYCKVKRYISEYCSSERIRQVGLLLDFVAKKNVKTFKQIRPQHLSEFICSLWRFSPTTVSRVVSDIRQFLKYLFSRNILTHNLSRALPKVHVARQANIPSVWGKDLLVQLLSAVDRSSPKGKRDYAILLLACRLGLRTGDIRNLTLEQINWEAASIFLIQSKTQRPLTLPLTNEIGNALIDYLKFARPKTHYRQVFLRLRQPYIPFSSGYYTSIIKYWQDIAGIKFKTQQHHGMHSLRHSLATYLLEEETSFPLISNILGHESTTSTMIYAKSSVEMLRQVALSLQGIDYVSH